MADGTYDCSEDGQDLDQTTPTGEIVGKAAQMVSRIRSMYDAGVPFFTKEAIRDLAQQLERAGTTGQKVSVRRLDGVMVDFDINTELVYPANRRDLEYIVTAPCIEYASLQSLTSISNHFGPGTAFCPLFVSHHTSLRLKLTKEIVDSDPVLLFEEVEVFFKTMQQAWEASEPCKQLRSTLLSMRTPSRINKIVGLACSPISVMHEGRLRPRSAFQNALLLTLQDVIGKKTGNPDSIICYAQDPAYTKIDKSVLKGSGIAVVDDPEAFLLVNDSRVCRRVDTEDRLVT